MNKTIAISILSAGLLAGFSSGCSTDGIGAAGGPDQQVLDRAARAIAKGEGRISPADLADRLIAEHAAPALIDLRTPQAFAAGHIRGSQNADIPTLLSEEGRSQLAEGVTPVLISERGLSAAQTAALLRTSDVDVLVLEGGIDAWQRYLNPGQGAAADAEEAQDRAKRQAAACWFEGDYVAAAGLTVKAPAMPAGREGGFVPPLEPVEARPAPLAPDPLGLGLGMGLGSDEVRVKKPAKNSTKKLKIGEGC